MLKLNKKVTYRFLDDEIVLLNLSTDRYYSLNRTGTLVFHALVEEHKSPRQIAALLSGKEKVPPEACLKDVKELLDDMKKEKILIDENV